MSQFDLGQGGRIFRPDDPSRRTGQIRNVQSRNVQQVQGTAITQAPADTRMAQLVSGVLGVSGQAMGMVAENNRLAAYTKERERQIGERTAQPFAEVYAQRVNDDNNLNLLIGASPENYGTLLEEMASQALAEFEKQNGPLIGESRTGAYNVIRDGISKSAFSAARRETQATAQQSYNNGLIRYRELLLRGETERAEDYAASVFAVAGVPLGLTEETFQNNLAELQKGVAQEQEAFALIEMTTGLLDGVPLSQSDLQSVERILKDSTDPTLRKTANSLLAQNKGVLQQRQDALFQDVNNKVAKSLSDNIVDPTELKGIRDRLSTVVAELAPIMESATPERRAQLEASVNMAEATIQAALRETVKAQADIIKSKVILDPTNPLARQQAANDLINLMIEWADEPAAFQQAAEILSNIDSFLNKAEQLTEDQKREELRAFADQVAALGVRANQAAVNLMPEAEARILREDLGKEIMRLGEEEINAQNAGHLQQLINAYGTLTNALSPKQAENQVGFVRDNLVEATNEVVAAMESQVGQNPSVVLQQGGQAILQKALQDGSAEPNTVARAFIQALNDAEFATSEQRSVLMSAVGQAFASKGRFGFRHAIRSIQSDTTNNIPDYLLATMLVSDAFTENAVNDPIAQEVRGMAMSWAADPLAFRLNEADRKQLKEDMNSELRSILNVDTWHEGALFGLFGSQRSFQLDGPTETELTNFYQMAYAYYNVQQGIPAERAKPIVNALLKDVVNNNYRKFQDGSEFILRRVPDAPIFDTYAPLVTPEEHDTWAAAAAAWQTRGMDEATLRSSPLSKVRDSVTDDYVSSPAGGEAERTGLEQGLYVVGLGVPNTTLSYNVSFPVDIFASDQAAGGYVYPDLVEIANLIKVKPGDPQAHKRVAQVVSHYAVRDVQQVLGEKEVYTSRDFLPRIVRVAEFQTWDQIMEAIRADAATVQKLSTTSNLGNLAATSRYSNFSNVRSNR